MLGMQEKIFSQLGSNTPTSSLGFQDVLSMSNSSVDDFEVSQGNKKQRLLQYCRLTLSVAAIAAVLIALSAISITRNLNGISVSGRLSEYVKFGNLINALQDERAISCIYLRTKNRRAAVDLALQSVPEFTIPLISSGSPISKLQLHADLNDARSQIGQSNTTCESLVSQYSDWNSGFLIMLDSSLQGGDGGDFCNLVDAYYSMIWATELESKKTAYGGDYWMSPGSMSHSEYDAFTAVLGVGPMLVVMARQRNDVLYASMNATVLAAMTALMKEITPMERMILQNKPYSNLTIALHWLDINNKYQDILGDAANTTQAEIYRYLKDQATENRNWFIGVLITCIFTVLCCPAALFWYALKSDRLMEKVRRFNQELKTKAAEVTQEKRITEILLYQILPPTLADQLRAGRKPEPEYYEEVTIFFSDIKGFTALSAKSSTSEIILLLNKLYTIVDAIVDRYDVYKVETIGDAYMIASGLPNRNGQQHSEQMATLALNVLQELNQFYIPHRPNERLLIRIGLHTVNTASRMESTGEANRIQISHSTQAHLERYHQMEHFDTVSRGSTFAKGKGNVATYWLQGKANFPYRVNIEAAEQLVNTTEYWKSTGNSYTNQAFEADDCIQLFGVVPSGKVFNVFKKCDETGQKC